MSLPVPRKKEIVSINPVTFDRDTAYYVLQYSEGWEVVSADKRGPIILAFSDTGDYDSMIVLSVMSLLICG